MTKEAEEKMFTHFAPAERVNAAALEEARAAYRSDETAFAMLEGMPDPAIVLDLHRQVVTANRQATALLGRDEDSSLVGLRAGEMVGCVHAAEEAGGCGTAEACRQCGAVLAILETMQTGQTSRKECRISLSGDLDGGALDLCVVTTPLQLGDQRYVVTALRDISAERRRRVLERVFFHDVMNTAGGLQGLAELLADEEDPEVVVEYLADVRRLSSQIVEEIQAQRLLMAAETGELEADLRQVELADLLQDVVAAYRHHPVAEGRRIALAVAEGELRTDPTLLKRVLGNLLKNALEATPSGGEVSLSVERNGSSICFKVHNPTVMPEAVQRQIFKRSFSTKGGTGRGIGTHSVRLFTERHLGGRVTFVSNEAQGTTFEVKLPV